MNTSEQRMSSSSFDPILNSSDTTIGVALDLRLSQRLSLAGKIGRQQMHALSFAHGDRISHRFAMHSQRDLASLFPVWLGHLWQKRLKLPSYLH